MQTTKYSSFPFFKWNNPANQIYDTSILESLNGITGTCLLTGEISGVMVVDLDNHEGGESGTETFKKIWPDTPETLIIETPNKGKHIYFQYRKDLKSLSNMWPGVDLKTDGGLIMTPGSQKKKEDGSLGSYEVFHEAMLQEMPEELFNKFLDQQKKRNDEGEEKKDKKNTRSGRNGLDDSVYKTGKRNDNLYRDGLKLFSKSPCRDYTTIFEVLKGLNLVKCCPSLEEIEVAAISKSVYNSLDPDYCNEGGHVELYPLMEHLIQEQPIFCRGNLTFQYDESKGYYKQMELNKLHAYYFDHCQLNSDKIPVKAKNFVDLLFMVASDPEDTFLEKNFINCKNGLVEWRTGKLILHDPQYRLISQIRAKYREVPLVEFKNSRFKQYLYETLDPESILTLQEACGLALSPHSKEVQKCFVLLGLGGNGKSLFLNILNDLLGAENISSIGFSDFSKDFDMSAAEGVLANIKMDDDMTGLSEKIGFMWKSFTCGERLRVNKKFKDIKNMTFNVTGFYGLNKLPSIAEKVNAVFRRLCIVDFKKIFGSPDEVALGMADAIKDPLLEAYIIENELEIVLKWGIEGLKRLNNNNWVLTEGKATKEALETYKLDSDSVYGFFKECISSYPSKKITNSKLYATYKWWCEGQGLKPMNGSNLGKQLKALKVESCKISGQRGYRDIEVVDPLGCIVNINQ